MALAVRPALPIDEVLPALRDALRGRSCAVLQAAPGAGKTTRVPLALLGEPWLGDQKIVVLEPRRLAARAAALFMARTLGEQVGATIGYRVRMDTRVGPRTRVEVVTEGVLTRMLQHDPSLDGVGAVIFDEFHERSLHADLGLALALQTQSVLRPELRLLVMSATLDGERVAAMLGRAAGAPPASVITSAGRSWPVDVRWRDQRPERRPGAGSVEAVTATTVRDALRDHDGDVLVFLPGVAEIRRVVGALDRMVSDDVRVMPLYGNLPQDAQDAAIAPSLPGRRKVVLATTIAETSLTIEGVRVVVDSGLARVPRFSARTGMSRLETARISRASSDQRCGRAGRLGPGVCYRLWPEHEHLLPFAPPEIADADLAPLALELSAAGIGDPSELLWLDPPPAAAFRQARELLAQLGAVRLDDARAVLTPHGARMAELPLHPRLAHMVLRGAELGHAGAACDLAALLVERDVLRAEGGPVDADVRLRIEALHAGGGILTSVAPGARVDEDAMRRVRLEARSLRATLHAFGIDAATSSADRTERGRGVVRDRDRRDTSGAGSRRGAPPTSNLEPDRIVRRSMPSQRESSERDGSRAEQIAAAVAASGLLLALAYPDRLAQRRPGPAPRYVLRNGRGATLVGAQTLALEPWLVAAELTGSGQESQIQLAAPVSLEALDAIGELRATRDAELTWDTDAGVVRARIIDRLGALTVRETVDPSPDPDAVVAVVLATIRTQGLDMLPWGDGAQRLRERLAFLHALDSATWPAVSDDDLLATLDDWLAPLLRGVRRRDDLARIDLGGALLGRLSWTQRSRVDELAPTHVEVPSGSNVRIDYASADAPVLAVRLQEMFGATDTPRVGGGRVPLTLHLLSPAHRPVQVTRDLAGFWRGSYFDVRRELRGRYPKHEWPEDPLHAQPTARAKRRP